MVVAGPAEHLHRILAGGPQFVVARHPDDLGEPAAQQVQRPPDVVGAFGDVTGDDQPVVSGWPGTATSVTGLLPVCPVCKSLIAQRVGATTHQPTCGQYPDRVASTRLTDRAIARALRLPAPNTGYSVDKGYASRCATAPSWSPTTTGRLPAPARHHSGARPYGRSLPFALIYARIYAARGYHVLLQSVRGTFGSGGTFVPMVHEVDDAADTVAWLREQPWFTGTFATIGLSYLGFTQWALLSDPPPELAAAVISIGPHDLYASTWGSGAFALGDFLGWADMMAHQSRARWASVLPDQRDAPAAAGGARRAVGRGRRALLGGARRGTRAGWHTPTATIRSGRR